MKKDARIDRRSFIKGVALSGATVGTLGLLSACSSPGNTDSSSSNNLSWDKEVGFLVVGSGTGAFAALAAMDLGAESVCVLEKNKTWGGTSAMSGGGFG
ncbi:MAG: FAD-binding protein, partial [Raoultibacter sp.]